MADKRTQAADPDSPLFYQVYLKATPALAAFRKVIGKANYELNTVRAGLCQLAKLSEPPAVRFAVVWKPHDLARDIVEAEAFAIRALLVYAVDVLDRYMFALGATPTVLRDPRVVSIVRREFQSIPSTTPASSTDVSALSAALAAPGADVEEVLKAFRDKHLAKSRPFGLRARFDTLMTHCPSIPAHHRAAVHLLVAWRNRHAHGESNDNVAAAVANDWRQGLVDLKRTNPRADGAALIARFEARESPTADDVTTLIALLHRTITAADRDLIAAADAETYALQTFVKAFRDLDAPIETAKALWGRTDRARASKFLSMTQGAGFRRVARTRMPAGANAVADSLWLRFARLDRPEFLDEIDRASRA